MCICDFNNQCYQPSNNAGSVPEVLFASYCEMDRCTLRAINLSDEYQLPEGGAPISSDNQYPDPNNKSIFKPLTDPAFLLISRISCNGCTFSNTCPN